MTQPTIRKRHGASKCGTAVILARVPSHCAARDRYTAEILARASTLCRRAGAEAAATAGITGGDAVDVAVRGLPGRAHDLIWMPVARENILMIIADQYPPHMPAP